MPRARNADEGGLTPSERRVVSARLAGKTLEQSGKEGYPNNSQPRSVAGRVMRKPRVKKSIQQELERAGITPRKRAEKLAELYDAEDNIGPLYKVQLDAERHISDLVGDRAPDKHLNVNVSEKTFLEQIREDAQTE